MQEIKANNTVASVDEGVTTDDQLNSVCQSNEEGFAHYLVRKELGLKRLPKGSKVWPKYPPS